MCVTLPNREYAYSETFIRAHVERLPARVEVLCGDWFPLLHSGGNGQVVPPWLRGVCFALRKTGSGAPRAVRLEQFAVRRFLRTRRIDVVLAEYGLAGVALMDVCAYASIPLVVHFHGWDAYDQRPLQGPGQEYQRMFDLSAAVIAVSRDMERQLFALGAPRDKLHYNPYGVDLSIFQGSDPAIAPARFLAVGRFTDKKAPQLTLLAFQQVIESHPDARLLMIGDGPLLEACKQLSRALGLAHAVEFAGSQPHSEISAAMRSARAFVQHSLRTSDGDSEGTPVALLEASASGLPVVSTQHGGIPDVVVHGETGLLVKEGDVRGMGEQMAELVRKPELAAALGRAGRKRISEQFSMERSIDGLWQIIEKAARG